MYILIQLFTKISTLFVPGGEGTQFLARMPESTLGGGTYTVQNEESTLEYFLHFLLMKV